MKAELISYTLEKASSRQKIVLHRALYGYEDISNRGVYRYQRKGLIDLINGRKLNRGVFIIPRKHKKSIISLLRKNKATIKTLPLTV